MTIRASVVPAAIMEESAARHPRACKSQVHRSARGRAVHRITGRRQESYRESARGACRATRLPGVLSRGATGSKVRLFSTEGLTCFTRQISMLVEQQCIYGSLANVVERIRRIPRGRIGRHLSLAWFTHLNSKAAQPPSFSRVRTLAPQLANKCISVEPRSQSSSGSFETPQRAQHCRDHRYQNDHLVPHG